VWLFISRIFSKVATIFAIVLIARSLGSDNFGIYSGIIALTIIAGLIADFGLVLPTVRSVSCIENDESRIVSQTLSARLFWSGISLCLIVILGIVLRFSIFLVLMFACSSILEVFMNGLIRTFEGRQEMKTITIFSMTERFVFSVFIAAGVLYYGSIRAVGVCYVVSYIIMTAVALYVFQRRFALLNISFSFKEFKKYSVIGFPFFLTAIASALYYKVDTLYLTAYCSPSQVGIYNAAVRVFDAQTFIPLSIVATVFPSLSRLYKSNNAEFFNALKHSIYLFIILGLAIGGGLYFASSLIINLLYSEAYWEAIPVLRILSLMIVFYFAYFIFGYGLMALHRESQFTIGMILAAVLNSAANYLVIPRFGYVGASWVRVFTEAILSVVLGMLLYFEIQKMKKGQMPDRNGFLGNRLENKDMDLESELI
jgi:O-antigen/teichoic acid export membrane protein